MRDGVALEATAVGAWFDGMATCLPFLARHVLGSLGRWRLVPRPVACLDEQAH
ncbi:hypothetical protein [Nonomuraea dietziae]|uniref:Uncharacterized protein n=1 Tax=Nonomuraea dietziae TaxID=65515 RepID=A0A7W5VFG7_9ACTN|nr:hypothetical protein [Nonomuraea dietziae]MBB3733931.1 hypothetical protein [Nonomuraea dietziae]